MKKLIILLGALALLGTTGCIVREHDYRGGYYGHDDYGHGYYHESHHDWDGDRDHH